MNPGSSASKLNAAVLLLAAATVCVGGAWYAGAVASRCEKMQDGLGLARAATLNLSTLLSVDRASGAAGKPVLDAAIARLGTAISAINAADPDDPAANRWESELHARALAVSEAETADHRRLSALLDGFGETLYQRARTEAQRQATAATWQDALLATALLSLAGAGALSWRLRHAQATRSSPGPVPPNDEPLPNTAIDKPAAVPPYSSEFPAEGLGSTLAEDRSGSPSRTSLELWHGLLTRLLEDPDSVEPFILLLREIEELTGAVSSAIVVTSGSDRQTVLLACTYAKDHERFAHFARNPPVDLRVAGYGEVRIYDDPSVPGYSFVASWLRQGELGYGFLLLRMPAAVELSRTEIDLLSLHSERLARIIYSTRRARQTLRVAQYQERAAIARELHDSLAQSLSYLKIQAARLQSLMGRDETAAAPAMHDEVDSVLQELRENLNVAYRQLRELITTFRLTMRGRSFGQALEDSVDEFAKRSSIAFDVDNRLSAGTLSVAEELQLLQIIREALSNAVRHSHANFVEVSVSSASDGILRVTIDDDGIGTDPTRRRARNHGIIIMQERAQSLKGEMRIDNAPRGGTRVQIQFRPSKYSGNPPPVI